MKKLAFAALFMGATGLAACGGGDDDGGDVTFTDSGPGGDSGQATTCNPVTQTGCDPGEKCSWLVVSEEPFLGRTDCVPDGTVAVGDACTEGAAGETTGFDNCAAGGLCMNGTCRAICSINPDSCPAPDFACASYENTFSDDTANNTGVCDPTCDPIAQDCAEGQGCYLQLFDGIATCAGVPTEAAELRQGDTCLNNGSQCYLNGCAAGYTGFIATGVMGQPRTCTAYCSPVNTYLNDPDGDGTGEGGGGGLIAGADADGTAPDCSITTIGVGNHQCRFFQTHPADTETGFLDAVSPTIGFCAPIGEIYGDCTNYSEEYLLRVYDGQVDIDPDLNGGNMEVSALCDQDPTRCSISCYDLETLVGEGGIWETYCAGPGAGGTFCSSAARVKNEFRRNLYLHAKKRAEAAGLELPALGN